MDNRTIKQLCQESHETAVAKGWWESGDRNLFEVLFLIHTEVSEAGEELRNGHSPDHVYCDPSRSVVTPDGRELAKPEGFLPELADVFIRVADIVERLGLTEEFALTIEHKLEYNKYRPYRHGGKTA